jgi:hypothetical protein
MAVELHCTFFAADGKRIFWEGLATGSRGKQQEFKLLLEFKSAPQPWRAIPCYVALAGGGDVPADTRAIFRTAEGATASIPGIVAPQETGDKVWAKAGNVGDALVVQLLLKKQDSGLWRTKKLVVTTPEDKEDEKDEDEDEDEGSEEEEDEDDEGSGETIANFDDVDDPWDDDDPWAVMARRRRRRPPGGHTTAAGSGGRRAPFSPDTATHTHTARSLACPLLTLSSARPFSNGIFRSDGAPASLPPASSSLTHARRMDGFCNQNADQLGSLAGLTFPAVYVGVVDCATAFLPPASSFLTHTRRMDGFCNQNADQLGSLAGLSFPAVYVGVVDCATAFLPPASSSLTHYTQDGWFLQPERRPARLPRRTILSRCICRCSRLRDRLSPPRVLLPHTLHAGWMVSATRTPTSSAPSQDYLFPLYM